MYNSYHSLMTTLKSPYFVSCCNKFIINADFVLLQVTILKRSQIANDSDRYSSRSVGSAMVLDSNYRSMFCAPFAWVDSFVCGYLSCIMKVYSDRNNIQVELIRLRKKYQLNCRWKISGWTTIYEIRLIVIREVSPPFGEERAMHCGRTRNFFSS